MDLTRRFLVLAALGIWQGGATFYAGVVVPVGRQTIGPEQSRVTRRVTHYLHLIGAAALPVLAWMPAREGTRRQQALRRAAWLGLAITLATLFWLHRELEARLGPDGTARDPAAFSGPHRWYLLVGAVQLACAIAYTAATVLAWRTADRTGAEPGRPAG